MHSTVKSNEDAAKWAVLWQPLFAAHPTPWRLEEPEPGLILVKDGEGTTVLQYNQHTHPGILASDRKDNARALVNRINNF